MIRKDTREFEEEIVNVSEPLGADAQKETGKGNRASVEREQRPKFGEGRKDVVKDRLGFD